MFSWNIYVTFKSRRQWQDRFLEIPWNIHFANNLQQYPPKDSKNYDRDGNFDLSFIWLHNGTFPIHFAARITTTCQWAYVQIQRAEAYVVVMKNKPTKWWFIFWFQCGSKSGYVYEFDMYLRKKAKAEFGLGESVILSLSKSLKNSHYYLFFRLLFYKSECWSCWKTPFMELEIESR